MLISISLLTVVLFQASLLHCLVVLLVQLSSSISSTLSPSSMFGVTVKAGGGPMASHHSAQPIKHTQQPIVTGTSVVGVKVSRNQYYRSCLMDQSLCVSGCDQSTTKLRPVWLVT